MDIDLYLQAVTDFKNNKISFSEFEKIRSQFGMNTDSLQEMLSIDFASLVNNLKNYLAISDLELVLRVLIGVVLSNRLAGNPVWLLLVGEPSSGKTELLSLLYNLENVHFLSSLTQNTLASGMRGEPGLLSILKPSPTPILITKDFNTLMTLQPDKRNEILSQLREIYDGKYSKRFGNGVYIQWQGKIGFIGASTPVIENYLSDMGILGERFILYRMEAEGNPVATALKAVVASGQEVFWQNIASKTLKEFFNKLPVKIQVSIPTAIQNKLAYLSAFTVQARSPVRRDRYTREVIFVGSESSPRLAKSLAQLCKGVALSFGRVEVQNDDFDLILEVALSSIPSLR